MYRRKSGTAMGTWLVPSWLVGTIMLRKVKKCFEEDVFNIIPLKQKIWLRNVDVIFVI